MRDNTDGDHTPPNEIVSNVKDALDDLGRTRRSFLAGTGTLLGASALSGTALAKGDDEDEGQGDGNGNGGMGDLTDVDVLNYALTLEHLEDVFYREGLNSYDEQTVMNARVTNERFGDFIRDDLYANLQRVGEHEATHVEALTATIEELGGDPVPECTYEFGYGSFNEFLQTAALLENTGVAAYNGAIALIDDPGLQTTGATIATVEARHASYLNLLNGEVPFPGAFDEAKSMQEILDAAGGFIVECPDGMDMGDGNGNGGGGSGDGGGGSGDGHGGDGSDGGH